MLSHLRTVDRGSNPFAPIVKQQNQALTPRRGVYESLEDRVSATMDQYIGGQVINQAVDILKQRLGGKKFTQEHFGRLEMVPMNLIDINVDIQRDLDLYQKHRTL